MSKITNINNITFKRVKHPSCIEYKIFVKEFINDEYKEYLLDVIPNPNVSLDIKERISLEYNDKQKWKLREEITGVNSSSIDVYVNGNKLTPRRYTFNIKNKILYIHVLIPKDSAIEVEDKLDIVSYSHKTSNKCEYNVIPVFERNHLIGCHNIL